MIAISKHPAKRAAIESETAWLNAFIPEPPLRIRCLVIASGLTPGTFPKCRTCGEPVSYCKATQSKLNSYCCQACRPTGKHLTDEAKALLADRDWLYQKRIVEGLSYKAIGESIGCSEVPVRKAAKQFNIPEIRLNESQPLVSFYLRNRDWLIEQHVNQQKTLDQIASEIGSHKATISRWLAFHEIVANPSNIYPRRRNYQSNESSEVVDYITSLGFDIETNNRSILGGKELDIVIPAKKLAVEYNGIYSHLHRPEEANWSKRKDRTYHLWKSMEAEKHGYRLIHIWGDDWKFRRSICESILAIVLGKADTRLYARKCRVVVPTANQKNIFLQTNHLQGKDSSTVAFGLEHDGELVAVMTFCRARYNKKFDWELSRFAVKSHTIVAGAFSRLLKRFQSEYSGSIISYADRSRSNGGVYQKAGFRLLKINPPGYYYVNLNTSSQRLHRSNWRKNRIGPDDPRPEHEIMADMGYERIWDCGQLVFVK